MSSLHFQPKDNVTKTDYFNSCDTVSVLQISCIISVSSCIYSIYILLSCYSCKMVVLLFFVQTGVAAYYSKANQYRLQSLTRHIFFPLPPLCKAWHRNHKTFCNIPPDWLDSINSFIVMFTIILSLMQIICHGNKIQQVTGATVLHWL